MSSTQEKPLDLTPLDDTYDIVGQIAVRENTRLFTGKRKSDGRDVLVTVMRGAADVAQGKAIAQFAADANLLATMSHPNVPQVVEGRWVGDDAFALITDRIQGTTLAELLKGDRLTNPRIATILGDVDGVLTWARGERLSHRDVNPDGIWIERGTGKVYVSLSPTEAPKTNRPDARDDARTIGSLALTMLTARPMADDHDGTLINMRPDLPRRIIDATEKTAACTINDEQPDIAALLAGIAMADAIKEGEVEVARIDAEFRAQMKEEREKWEAEQQMCQLAHETQAKKFGEERAEYERRAAKEREQLASARSEVDKRRIEVQEARAELDQARAAYKQKKAELEARSKQVDKHMSDLEKQKRSLEKRTRELEKRAEELEQKNQELREIAALAAAGAAAAEAGAERSSTSVDGLLERLRNVDEFDRVTQPVPVVDDDHDASEPLREDVEELQEAIVAEEEVKGWTPIENEEPWSVPLETDEPVRTISYEAAALPEKEKSGRPRWVIPAGVAGFLVLIVGAAYAVSRSNEAPVVTGALVASATPPPVAVTRPDSAVPAQGVPDSAAGVIAPLSDSATFTALRDSIVAADAARRARRERAAAAAAAEAERRRAAATVTDSLGQVWSTVAPPPADSVRRADSVAKARRDSLARVRPDTLVRPDTVVRKIVGR